METFLNRYRNLILLLVVLLAQVIGLAVQVRKPGPLALGIQPAGSDRPDGPGVRLIRLWASDLVTPFERAIHGSSEGATGLWGDYLDLRHTREQNKDLQQTIDRLRLEQATLLEDAKQGHRLQELLNFQQKYIYKTVAAQVIGTSGNTQSQVIYLDKGAEDGLATDMAVISQDGIVGKVRDVFPHTAQVLMINDQTSGAGVVLATTRTRGILRGNANGQPQVINILADDRIKSGDQVLTAGGDQIFPRGLPVGVVEQIRQDPERGSFINVIVKPAANLQHLDEVLVITSLDAHLSPQQQADLSTSEELKGAEVAAEAARKKAAAEMEERLPGLHDANSAGGTNGTTGTGSAGSAAQVKGPDGKVIPVPLVTPKPLPPKHADRFTPGGEGEAPARRESSPGENTDGSTSDPSVVTKPKPKAVPRNPDDSAAPNAGTPKTTPATPPQGEVQ